MSAEALRIERAMRMVRDRHRLLAEILESERGQGWPAKFPWPEWRLSREELATSLSLHRRERRVVEEARSRHLAMEPPLPRTTVVHNPVDKLNGSQ
jgi:hypothetical protein